MNCKVNTDTCKSCPKALSLQEELLEEYSSAIEAKIHFEALIEECQKNCKYEFLQNNS